MTQYIKPILFAVLISLASSTVFAASNVSGTDNPDGAEAARRTSGGTPPASAEAEEEDTTGYWPLEAVQRGLGAVSSAAAAAARRVGAEFGTFTTETVPEGVTAMGEDAAYAGGLIATHAQAAGTALSGYAAATGDAVKDHATTMHTAVMGKSDEERDAAAGTYHQPVSGALRTAADFAAQYRAPDAASASSAAGGAGAAVTTAGAPAVRSDPELVAAQAAKLAAHNAGRTGGGSGGDSSADPS